MSFLFSKCETNLNPYSSKIHKPLRYKVEKKRTRFIALKSKTAYREGPFFFSLVTLLSQSLALEYLIDLS